MTAPAAPRRPQADPQPVDGPTRPDPYDFGIPVLAQFCRDCGTDLARHCLIDACLGWPAVPCHAPHAVARELRTRDRAR